MISITKTGLFLGYIDVLQIYLIALKFNGHIKWAWGWVLLPYIFMSAYYFLMGTIIAIEDRGEGDE